MALMDELLKQAQAEGDTDVSARARYTTNPVGRKLYQAADLGEALINDLLDRNGDERTQDLRVSGATSKLFGSAGEKQMQQEYIYDPINDEYITATPSKLSANDLIYQREELEKQAEENSKTFYDIHYAGDPAEKIGVTSQNVDIRHPLARTRGGMVNETKLKDAYYFEDEVKNYLMDKNANVFGMKHFTQDPTEEDKFASNQPRSGEGKKFTELGLDKGKSEVFDKEKIAVSLPDIAAAIDTARTPEEKLVLQHKFDIMQERILKNQRQAGQMKYLAAKREQVEALDEKEGGVLSPSGFGDFKTELEKDPRLFEAYKDLYNREDVTGDLEGKPRSMQRLMIEQFMSEKSNQIQEAVEDLGLSKNESAIVSDLIGIYRASDLTPGQATQAIANSVFDPANLVPAALAGKIKKYGGKIVDVAYKAFGKGPASKKASQIIAGAAGGGVSTGIEDVARQQVDVNAQRKEDIDWKQAGVSTAVGAIAGGAIVKGLQVVSDKVGNILKSKKVEDSANPAEFAAKIEEARQDKSLTSEEKLELDKYEYEVFQETQQKPKEYKETKTLEGSRERADTIADEIEAEAEVEVAASAKPEAPVTEKEPVVAEKEKEKEEDKKEKLTLIDQSTGEEVEVDLGSTTRRKDTPVVNMREEDRLPMAKEFILGKGRIRRAGDETSIEGDTPTIAPQQIHSQGRSVSQAVVDTAGRTVEQKVTVKETPEASVANVMKGYDLYQKTASMDPEKRIAKSLDRMESEILAIEGMKQHYKEEGIPGDFTKLDKYKETLVEKVKERSASIYDRQVDYDAKAELAKTKLDNMERDKDIADIKKQLEDLKVFKDVPKMMEEIEKVINYSLGEKLLQRIKKTQRDEILESDTTASSPMLTEIKRILKETDKNGKPLKPIKIKQKLEQTIPRVVKDIMRGAKDDASKIVAIRITDAIDAAAGTNRKLGTIPKKEETKIKQKKDSKDYKPSVEEKQKNEWKEHSEEKELTKMKRALESNKNEVEEELFTGVKGQIYAKLKDSRLPASDRADLVEALTHKKTQSSVVSPIELTKMKLEKFYNKKNNEKSQKIFNKDLVSEGITPVSSVRGLYDASSQVAQIVGVFFGDLKLFKAIGATKDTAGVDYRKVIGKVLQGRKIIPEDVEDVKAIVKVPTRNVTYIEGRDSAIAGMIEQLDIPYQQAAKIYDGIIAELRKSDAGGLLKYADKIAKAVQDKKIPAKFDIILPSGRKIKVDARQKVEEGFRHKGIDYTREVYTDEARPGQIAATIVQSIDSYIKDTVISKMTKYDGITVHDGFAFKPGEQQIRAQEIYFDTLKEINESNYFNKMLTRISDGAIPLEQAPKINWSEVDPAKLLLPEFEAGIVPSHEIRSNMSLNEDRIMEPTEILASLLNSADPTGKTGFSGMRHSVVRYLNKSEENRTNRQTFLSELDAFVSQVLHEDTLGGMQERANAWKTGWMKKNKIVPSRESDEAFEQLTNMIRATAEGIPEFTKDRLMPREGIMNDFARIYFKNLAEAQDLEWFGKNKALQSNIEKGADFETIVKSAEPEDMPVVMDIARQVVEEENGKDIPTMAQEKKIVEAGGKEIDESLDLESPIKKSFDEAYRAIRQILHAKKITEADISHATHNSVAMVKEIFKASRIKKDEFKKMVLDSGYRHIRGMNKEQAIRFVELHKATAEKYGKYIDAKARAHTNPNERYGYFRNNMLELVMEKEGLDIEKAAVRANAILKLSAIKNMTDEHWNYVAKQNNQKAAKQYLDIIDIWDAVAKEQVFKTGKKNFNDSYLATVRGKGLIDLDMEPESKMLELNTIGKIVDDEATLKSLGETDNIEGYMENHKIRKVGKEYYRILIDERAEKAILEADPVDILSKTVFTTMAKAAGSDESRNTRKLLDEGVIFSSKKEKGMRPLTKEEKEELASRAKIDVKEIKSEFVNEVLARQMFGKKVYEPMGKKAHDFTRKLTQDFKYNVVPINPNSILNGAFWSVVSVVGRHPIKGIPALIKASRQMYEYKKLDTDVKKALETGDMNKFIAALEKRAEHPVFKAISDGMSINALDGITQSHSLLKGTSEKIFGKDTKALHLARTIFLRPHTPIASNLIKAFSLSDSVGRMASYNLMVGTKHDTGVGAGIKANATFGDMSHVSGPLVESLDEFPVTAFIKWGERTFIEILKLPRAQQASLIASGLLVTNLAEDYDIEDKGFNPLRTFAEIPDDFIVAPIQDNYNKYQGETSNFEHAVRATTQFVLPSTYNRVLMSYLFDERSGSVQAKLIKLVFPPRGVDYTNPANGTRISYKGNKIPLTTFDSRPWWEQMTSEDSRKTQEQYDAGQWRRDMLEAIVGKETIDQWKKENRLKKIESLKYGSVAYGNNLF